MQVETTNEVAQYELRAWKAMNDKLKLHERFNEHAGEMIEAMQLFVDEIEDMEEEDFKEDFICSFPDWPYGKLQRIPAVLKKLGEFVDRICALDPDEGFIDEYDDVLTEEAKKCEVLSRMMELKEWNDTISSLEIDENDRMEEEQAEMERIRDEIEAEIHG